VVRVDYIFQGGVIFCLSMQLMLVVIYLGLLLYVL